MNIKMIAMTGLALAAGLIPATAGANPAMAQTAAAQNRVLHLSAKFKTEKTIERIMNTLRKHTPPGDHIITRRKGLPAL